MCMAITPSHRHVKPHVHYSSTGLHIQHKCAWQIRHRIKLQRNSPGLHKEHNCTWQLRFLKTKQTNSANNNGNNNNNVLFANDNRQNKTKEATTPVNNCWEILLVYFPSTNTHSNAFPRQANRTFAAWLEVVTRTINCVYMRHTEEKRKMCEEKVRCTSYKSTFPCTIINLGDQTSRLSHKSLPRKPA